MAGSIESTFTVANDVALSEELELLVPLYLRRINNLQPFAMGLQGVRCKFGLLTDLKFNFTG